MTVSPPPGVVRFNGTPDIFYMAICRHCEIALPFGIEDQRTEWMQGHATAPGHSITDIAVAVDIRPAAGTVGMVTR